MDIHTLTALVDGLSVSVDGKTESVQNMAAGLLDPRYNYEVGHLAGMKLALAMIKDQLEKETAFRNGDLYEG